MSNIADLYKKKEKEKRLEEERKRREEEERQARLAAQEAKEKEDERRRQAENLAARKRILRESGLLSMLEELKRELGFAYTIDHSSVVTEIVVGQVGTAEYPRWTKSSDAMGTWTTVHSMFYDKWKVIYGARVLVFENGIRVKDTAPLDFYGRWFSTVDGWSGLKEALVDAISIGIANRCNVKQLRKAGLFGL